MLLAYTMVPEKRTSFTASSFDTGDPLATRCTEAVLNAFGIYGIIPQDGSGVLEALRDYGYHYEDTDTHTDYNIRWKNTYGTVRRFAEEHTSGSYYIVTADHGMALIDGHLIDYEDKGFNTRRVILAYRVWK